MKVDGLCHSKSSKWKYANIFKGSLVLLGMSPRPKTKGKESKLDQIEDYTSQRGARKMWRRIVMEMDGGNPGHEGHKVKGVWGTTWVGTRREGRRWLGWMTSWQIESHRISWNVPWHSWVKYYIKNSPTGLRRHQAIPPLVNHPNLPPPNSSFPLPLRRSTQLFSSPPHSLTHPLPTYLSLIPVW